jgi:hypothetical protein
VFILSNPENGIYIGKLNNDLDLVWFHQLCTFGIYWTEKPITIQSKPWPHKQPLTPNIEAMPLKNWSKYGTETEQIIDRAYEEGYNLTFEGNIRPAINEILDSIRNVHHELSEELEELDEGIIHIPGWKNCQDCECYKCYKIGQCGKECENPNKQCDGLEDEGHVCNYDNVNEHGLCKYQDNCQLRSG